MRKIVALSILTAAQYPTDRVGVYCTDAYTAQQESERWLGVSAMRNVVFFEKGTTSDKICGYRFHIILVEGQEGSQSEEFVKEIRPYLSVCHNPPLCQKLSEEMGSPVPSGWIKQPKVVFTDSSRIRRCYCNKDIDIDNETREQHSIGCNYTWGRRGWRQIGEYDG